VHAEAWPRAVVGIEIPIEELLGTLKVSQDETTPDREGTLRGLMAQGCGNAAALAAWVQDRLSNAPAS